MNRLVSLLLLIFVAQFSHAQLANVTADNEYGISTQTGQFSLDDAPIDMNIPVGFMFIDGKTSRNILTSYWGNQQAVVEDVVGMIIPDTTSTVEYINRAWIISHKNIGHVQDNKAGSMGFSWILDAIKNSENNGYTVEWAWEPKYDTEHHRLSLPILYITGTDSIIRHRQTAFGNTGMIEIEPVVPLSDLKWLSENDEIINNAVEFSAGSRYEDFDSINQTAEYNSVSSFLKGITTHSSNVPVDFSSNEEESSFSDMVIKIIAKVAIVLVAIMLILMFAVALTNRKNESSKGILQSGINVLLRIGVFGMVYLLVFTFAIFLIWVGVWFTIGLLSYHLSIRSIICVVGGWIIIGGFLLAIIKSLFVYSHSEYPNRLEITQSEAPSLFKLIEEISNSVGEKMPKHVYISPDVNACVFYNKPFISLFFQSRKNLEVGLGLLFGLNRQEFKAVIAHEYGHFGQKSMRVGQVVTICYNIISNLVNSDKVFLVQPILKKTFIYVQKGYMALSRSMEYEADSKSAMIAGNEAAISALCKIEIIAERFNVYNSLVQSIHDSKNIIPTSYWNGYKEFQTLVEKFDGIILDETVTASEPLSNSHKSKVKLKNPWISHPLLEQRIESIKLLSFSGCLSDKDGIQNVVPSELYNESSRLLFVNADYSSATVCNDKEYHELLDKELGEQSFTLAIRSFFNRDFCGFEVNPDEEISTADSNAVFSETNAQLVESFTQAISDYQLMVMFKNKQTSEKQIQYDGRVYNRKNVPIETQLNIIKGLEPRIASIDKAICLLALSKTPNKGLIMKAYDDIFYAQSIIRHISNNVLPSRDLVAKQIGKGGDKDEESFKRVQRILLNFKANLQELIKSIEISRLNPVMHVDTAKSLNHIEDEWLLEGPSISGEEIQYIFTLPDQIIAQFQALAYFSKKIISDTIEDKEPLVYWNNSVSAQTEQTQGESRNELKA